MGRIGGIPGLTVGVAVDAPAGGIGAGRAQMVTRISAWLLAALAVDLLVTRFLVRLAIFVPKGEPWSTLGSLLGRIGAATDALVPLVGLLLLVALLLEVGRRRDPRDGLLLMGVAVVAAGGLAMVAFPPTPAVAFGLDLVVVLVALGAGLRLGGLPGVAGPVRVALVVLSLALALAAAGRLVGHAGWSLPAAGSGGDAAPSLLLTGAGEILFVAGAALLGLAGLVLSARRGLPVRGYVMGGLVVGIVTLAPALFAPGIWGSLLIWSLGISGWVPALVAAGAIGLAAGGLPALYRVAPGPSMGAAIVLFAGYGLAASGLVLAGLLGLIVARARET